MKHLFSYSYLFLALIASIAISAQEYQISGKIVSQSSQPIEFIEVSLLSSDSIALKSELTNEKGIFEIKAEKGIYTLKIEQFGQEYFSENIEINQDKELGLIKIQEATALEGVTIMARKKLIEKKVDRLVFNVTNSKYSSDGTAFDALKVTPGVRIQNESVSIIGKGRMIVMIEDKIISFTGDELVNFLRSIPANELKSIEVITNPPSKYEAEGNTGILNINLKKSKEDNWFAFLRSTYDQANYATGGLGGSFSIKKKKTNFTSSLYYKNGSIKRTEKDEIHYPNQSWVTDFNKRQYTNIAGGRLAYDYRFNDNFNIGVQYSISASDPLTKEKDYGVISNIISNVKDSLINTTARSSPYILFNNLNLYSKIKLDTLGRNISVDVTYLNRQNKNSRLFSTTTFYDDVSPTPNGFQSSEYNGEQSIRNYGIMVDMEHPLNNIKLSYGGKISYTKTENDIITFDLATGVPIFNDNQSNTFNYEETIAAVYFSAERDWGDKWSTKIGLRLEDSNAEGNSITLNQVNTNDYTELFPTFYLNYNYNKNNSLSLNYGRRIMRPNFSSLNPFRYYSSPYAYNEGNPFLKPQFDHTLELQHIFKENLTTSIQYINEKNGIGEVPFVDVNTNSQYFTYLNYFTHNSIVLSVFHRFNKFKWLESNNTIETYYFETKFNDQAKIGNGITGWGLYFSSHNALIFNESKTIRGEVNFWYQAPEKDLVYDIDGQYSLDLGIRYTFLKSKNLQLGIYIDDIFRSNKSRQKTYTNNVKQIYSNYSDRQRISFALSYSFGNNKARSREREYGNKEEINRVQ